MPELCSCGAQLPPDAVFCHKCGKPQREMETPEAETPVVVAAPVAQPAPEPLPLTFGNPVVLRIAFLVASIAAPLAFFVPFVPWMAGGFAAVVLYRRATGRFLSAGGGARVGSITGVVMLPFAVVFLTIQWLANGELASRFQDQIRHMAHDPQMEEAARFFQTPPGLAMMMGTALLFLFIFIVGLSMAGGALGAKFPGRNQPAAPERRE